MQVPVNIVASPLNYTGGKRKLLPQLLPLFPDNVSTFVDIFCGGCNVAVNSTADIFICNDINPNLTGLLSFMKKTNPDFFISKIKSIITDFKLSNTTSNGYSFYNCNTANGLGKYNKERFLSLRENFNSLAKKNDDYYFKLFVLIVFCFNNQIRFNSDGKFNLPVGKRDFNSKIQKKVIDFIISLQTKNIKIRNENFSDFELNKLPENSFVYADPPYLITCAAYNEKNGWTEESEYALLSFLDKCTQKNIKFALSNVLETDGKVNQILKDWLSKNKNYICCHLDYSYKNSNYQKKNPTNKSDEVLITNYEVQNG